ncbi:mediator of DNA damage checkpoint protein 1 isoform X5 [Pteropus alecto]|uniref:mediator of DNA damage checkpoint protein 1 isoform X5 n=1 Tax=Pteropus alecto TaxID=9402 RepID=UPI0007688912|nr:mediator of DNA damage checkpoint protein 1 isoform X5 [Pteropus alecto]
MHQETMIMEDTQAISWEVEEEEETERPNESLGHSLEPLGRLHIFSSAHGPEKDFPLYLGKNVVGRMPDCSVALPFPSISKQHAVIEILAWDKAPVLRDCGSLNGTQILRPPKVLSPGMSHRLRDQELVLFADLPCQYHRLNVPLPFVSRGPLTVEETPRVQGRTQPQGLLLAEDSEEEVDSLSERCVVKESRTTSSPVATVIPESDEEGPSLAPDGPGPPFAFNLDSDTDEEENQQPAAGEASSAATRDATAKTEQPKAVVTEIQLEKNQCSVKERNNDTKIESDARNGVVPIGVILERSQPAGEDSETDVDDESRPPGRPVDLHLERTQPSGFIDSDTDLEEEGVPATPAVDPMKKRQILHGVSTNSPGGLDLAHLQETLADSDTDVEKGEASLMVPLERSQASMVIDSNTDDEEEVSAALTLACLKESRAAVWNRDTDVEEDRTQPVAILEQSQTSSGKDSDTDVEEEGFLVEKRESVPKGHADKAHSEKSQPPFGDSDIEVEKDKSSPGVHLERNQASATMGINTQVEEEVPPGPAITLQEKHQMPVVRTNRTNMEAEGGPAKLPVVHLEEAQPPPGGDYETDAEEGVSLAALAVADERKSQLPAEREAECALAVLEQERALEAGAQGGSPVAQVEQDPLPVSQENLTDLVVDTGTPGEPTQPQRKGAQPLTESGREPHMDKTKDSRDNNDDSEDLDLQATQCFVERENQNLEGALDEPWEVLATQPFCPRESEASETQPIAAHLEAHGSCPSPSRAMRRDQHPESPVHAEPLESQGRGMQTVERGMGHLNCKIPPAEEPSRGDPESLDAYLPPTVPEASSPLETPLISQSQKHPAPQLLSPFPPSLEPPIAMTRQNGSQEALETPLSSELAPLHAEPKARLWGSSRMTSPVSSLAVEPHLTSSIDHPVSPKPTSWATRIRTRRFSEMTPAPVVPTAPELQSSTSKDQPVTPKPTSRVTRSRTRRSSVKTPAPVVPTGPEFQPSISTDQPITPKPTYRATRGRTHRSSVKTPEPSVPSAPELQLFISTNQPVTPKPTSRGRTHRSSVKTPEPIIPSAPELQHSTSMDQPVSSRPTSRATRGRTHRSSVKTPQSIVLTAPELQSSTSKGQSVTTELISGATWGRAHRSFVKIPEPVVPIVPELQPSTPTDHPVIPKPISQGRTPRSSVKTPESMVPTAPELQPSTKHQPVALEPTSRATRGRTRRSSVKTHQLESTALDLESLNPTDQPVTRKAIAQGAQSRTLRSTTSSVLVSTKLEFQSPTDQPIPPELIPQGNYSGRPRATRKRGSLSVPIIHEPCSAPPEPNSRSSRNQRRGAVKAAESRRTIPAPAFAQIPEAPTHAPQIQKAEEAGRYGFTPEPQPKASQNHKRPLGTADLPPLQKRLQRGEVSQKTAFLKEKEDPAERPGKEEDVVITGPGKRKRDQTEEEPKGMPGRSLRRTKLNESTAPKVLFTGVVDARGERAVLALGGSLASSVAEASHLVTDRIRRTVKFLCALGRGIPILSLDWLHQSRKAGCFLPPDEYVVTDPEQEKNFGFSLRDALSRAQKRRLLEGYEIHVTPGVQPPPLQMGEIISCCGGTVLSSMPRSYKPQRVVITCSQDFPRCSIPFRVGLPILSPEFLLTGVLKQEAKPEAFVLSTLEMSST